MTFVHNYGTRTNYTCTWGVTCLRRTGSSTKERKNSDTPAIYVGFVRQCSHPLSGEEVAGCYMRLETKGAGSLKAVTKAFHECKLRGQVSYNVTSVAKSSLRQPCTNRPFKCIVEGCNQILWTYSMKNHYEDKHASSEMPDEVKKEVLMRPHEMTYVSQLVEMTYVSRLVGGYSKKVKTVCPYEKKTAKGGMPMHIGMRVEIVLGLLGFVSWVGSSLCGCPWE